MDFTETYPDTCSSISKSVFAGDVTSLKKLIQEGYPVNVMDNRGWGPVHVAAWHGHVECLKVLLDQEEVSVDDTTFEREKPLLLAARGGHYECVHLLLNSGSDPNTTTPEKYSPLWEACLCNSLSCVKILLEAGAHVNSKTFTLDTPLHGVILKHGNIEMFKLLLQSGADLRMRTENGLTPLFLAAHLGRFECLKVLVEEAKKKGRWFLHHYVNKPAHDGATPLYIAVQECHVECVKLLIESGADPNRSLTVEFRIRLYPLNVALHKKDYRCVSLLAPVTNPTQFGYLDDISEERLLQTEVYHPIVQALYSDLCPHLKVLIKYDFFRYRDDHFPFNLFILDISLDSFILILNAVKDLDIFLANYRKSRALTLAAKEVDVFVFQLKLGCEFPCIKYYFGQSWYLTAFLAAVKHYSFLGKRVPYYIMSSARDAVFKGVVKHWEGWSDIEQSGSVQATAKSGKGVHIQGCKRLKHMCRINIILQLLHVGKSPSENLKKLPIPEILKGYLSFKDSVGDIIMDYCDELLQVEAKIEKALTKYNFPREYLNF